jgi:hypothetical protein
MTDDTADAFTFVAEQWEPETTEPRIFIFVERLVVGQLVSTGREIDLTLWLKHRPTHMVDPEIDAMLREVFYTP